MNARLHRVIFNAARGMRMVVQETATSTGKGTSGATGATGRPSGSGTGFSFSASTLAILAAMAALLLPLTASPQIIADPSAPRGQRPIILAAPNGVPIVDIQRPSAAGVSRSTYSQFDIGRNGAILNNSPTAVSTQLAGTVAANPWLNAPARVILNEVNSRSPSYLRGYVEVGGGRAEVIIANPSGIQVDGGGFINASKVTLTTGTVQLNAGGAIESFLVRGGTVVIDGQGLDLTRVDYAEILSRALNVNAGLWANSLKVVTGANQVSADLSQIVPTDGTGPTPTFALDVAALGGMYAGKIVLIGTEAGVGVRNAGVLSTAPANMAAGQPALSGVGEFVITSVGRLENLGAIQATARAALTSVSLGNSGTIASTAGLKIRTEGELGNTLDGKGGTLEAPHLDLVSTGGDINNQGATIRQTSTAALGVTAPAVSNTAGGIIGAEPAPAPAPGSAAAPAAGPATAPAAPTPAPVPSTAGTGNSGSNGSGGASPAAAPAPSAPPPPPGLLNAAGTIRNDAGRIYAGGAISLHSQNVDNRGGSLTLGDLTVTQPAFDNHNGTLNVGNFNAHVDRFDNSQGVLHAGNMQVVSTGDLLNVDGQLISDNDATLTVGGLLDNTRGTVSALHALNATVTGAVTNTAGTLIANQALTLRAAVLDNAQGTVQSSQAGTQVTVAKLLQNTGGSIAAGTDLSVAAGTLVNGNVTGNDKSTGTGTGTLRGTRDITVAITGAITSDGSITSGRNTTVTAASLDSGARSVVGAGIRNDGTLATSGDLSVTTTGALTARGQNLAAGSATFDGTTLDLTGSQTSAATVALTASEGNVTTSGATVSTPGTLSIRANSHGDQTLVNVGGTLTAGQLDLHAANIANTRPSDATPEAKGGQLIQTGAGATTIVTGVLDNSGGLIASNGRDLTLQATRLDNTGGELSHAGIRDAPGTLTIDTDSYSGVDGTLLANGALVVHDAGAFVQDGGNTSARQITMDVASLSNQAGGKLIQTGESATRIAASGALNNSGGRIQSNGQRLTLQAAQLVNSGGTVAHSTTDTAGVLDITASTLDNRQGHVIANGVLAVHAGAMQNDGGDINAQQMAIDAASLGNVAGQIVQGGTGSTRIAVTGLLDNDAGLIASKGQDMRLSAGTLTNVHGSVQHAIDTRSGAAGTLLVTAASVDNSHGEIIGNSALKIQTGALTDTSGTISAAQLDLDAASLRNQAGSITQSGTGATHVAVTGLLDNDGGRIATNGQDMTIQAGTLTNRDTTTGDARNPKGIQHAGKGTLTLDARDSLDNSHGDIVSNGALALRTGTFVNSAGHVTADQLTVDAQTLANQGGEVVQVGKGATHLAVTGDIDNSAKGVIATNGETFGLSAGNLNNTAGTVQHAGHGAFDLTTNTLTNNTGLIASNGALTLKATDVRNDAGSISADRITADVNSLNNQHGKIVQNGAGATHIAVTQLLDNSNHGLIASAGSDMSLSAGTVNNATGSLQHAGKGTFTLTTHGLDNTQGEILGNGALAVRAGDIGNNAGVISAKQIGIDATNLSNQSGSITQSGTDATHIAVTGLLDNTAKGLIATNGADLTLSSNILRNSTGQIQHAGKGTFALTALDSLDNSHGDIVSNGALALKTGTFVDSAGHVTADQLTVDAQSLVNQSGEIVQVGKGATHIAVARDIDNSARGLIATNGESFSLSAGNLNNTNGTVKHAGHGAFDLTTNTLTNSAGLIVSNGALTLKATEVQNEAGSISAEQLALSATNLHNAAGQINQRGSGATSIAVVELLDNSNHGLIASAGSDMRLTAGTVNNATGSLQHAGTGTFDLRTGVLSNEHGQILGNGALAVHAADIGNDAGVISARQIGIDATSLNNQAGSITQSGTGTTHIAIAGLLDNTAQGVIASNGSDMSLSADTLLNSTGQIQHAGKGALAVDVATLLDNSHGDIVSNGALALRTGTLVNSAGHVRADQLTVDAQTLANQGGEVVQLGKGATRIAVKGSIDNSAKGLIATNGETFSLSAGDLNNTTGTVQHAGHGAFDLTTGALTNNNGLIVSNGALTLKATEVQNEVGMISADQLALSAINLHNAAGQITQRGSGATSIVVDRLLDNSNHGSIASAGNNMSLWAGTVNNANGSLQHAGAGTFDLRTGALSNEHGEILDNGALVVHATDIGNDAGVISARQITVDGTSLSNKSGSITQSGTGATHLAVAGLIDNDGGRIATNGQDVTIQAGTLTNRDTATGDPKNPKGIQHAGKGTFNLTAHDSLDNSHGDIVSNGALALRTGTFVNSAGHATADQLTVDAQTLANQGGEVVQVGKGATHIAVDELLDNSAKGVIATNGETFSLSAGRLNNTAGTVQHAGHGAFDLTTGALTNDAGLIVSNGALTLKATDVRNNAGSISADRITADVKSLSNQQGKFVQNGKGTTHIAVDELLDNSDHGSIASAGSDMSLSAGTVKNATGSLQHAGAGTFTLTMGGLDSTHGEILGNGALVVHAKDIGNDAGVISARQITVDGTSLSNKAGSITQGGTGATRIAVTGLLDNDEGRIATNGQDVTIQAGTLTNRDTATGDPRNPKGIQHAGKGTLTIDAVTLLDNSHGDIVSNGALDLKRGAVSNASGHLVAQQVDMAVKSLNNQGGEVVQVGKGATHIAVEGSVDNSAKGVIATNGETFSLSAGSLNNTAGTVQHAGHSAFDLTTGALTNNTGLIVSNGSLTLKATDVRNNAGSISADRITADVKSLSNQQGKFVQNGKGATHIAVDELLDNSNHGSIASAGSDMSLSAGTVKNANGSLQHAGTGTFTLTTGGLDSTHGEILGNGALVVHAKDIGNDAGVISARQITVDGTSLSNKAGSITQGGTGATRIVVTGLLDNDEGRIATNGQDVTIKAGTVTNRNTATGDPKNPKGIQHAGKGTLAIDAVTLLDNSHGDIVSNGALDLKRGAVSNASGHLVAQQVDIAVNSLNNQTGEIVQMGQGATRIAVAGDLNNSDKGLIASSGNSMTMSANTLDNQLGKIQHSGNGTLDLTASTRLDNAQGLIVSNGALALKGGAIGNNTGTIAAHQLTVDVASLSNQGGKLIQSSSASSEPALSDTHIAVAALLDNSANGLIATSGTNLTLAAGTLVNDLGHIEHAGTGVLDLTAGQLTNASGFVHGNGALVLHGGEISNNVGHIDARQVTANVVSLSNRQGGEIVQSGTGATTFTVSDALDNSSGRIATNGQDLNFKTGSLRNDKGHLQHAGTGTLTINTGAYAGTGGEIVSNGALAVYAGSFAQNGGATSAEQITVNAESLSNRGGTIVQRASTGTVQNAGDMHIAVTGLLDNSAHGNIVGYSRNMELAAKTLVNTGGEIQHVGDGTLDIGVTSSLRNDQQGNILGNGALLLHGGAIDNRAGTIAAHQLTLNVASLGNQAGQLIQHSSVQGSADSGTTLIAVAGRLDNSANGKIASNGHDMTISAQTLTNDGGNIQHVGSGTLDFTVGKSTNAAGHIVSNHALVLNGGAIGNDAGFIDAKLINLNGVSLSNRAGSIVQTGTDATHITLKEQLDNDVAGRIGTNGQDLIIQAGSITNNAGHIQHAGAGTLLIDTASGAFVGTGGEIVSNGALAVRSGSFTQDGGHTSAEQITIDSGALNNRTGGQIVQRAAGDTHIAVAGTLNNSGGTISSAGRHVNVSAVDLVNDAGLIQQNADETGVLSVKTKSLSNAEKGVVVSQGILSLRGEKLSNDGGTLGGQLIGIDATTLSNQHGNILQQGGAATHINTTGLIDNSFGRIATNGEDLSLKAGAVLNNKGSIEHYGSGTLSLDTPSFSGPGGSMSSSGTLQLHVRDLNNDGSKTTAQRLIFDVDTLSNRGGTLVQLGSDDLQVTASTIDNTGGTLGGKGAVRVQTKTLDNTSGLLIAQNGALTVQTPGKVTNATGGRMVAGTDLHMDAAGLNNADGLISGRDVDITTQGQALDNTHGTIQAAGSTTVHSGALTNATGLIQAVGDLNIDTGGASLVNTGAAGHATGLGGIASTSGTLTLNTGELNNGAGYIGAGVSLQAKTGDVTNTGGGQIASNGNIAWHAPGFDNTQGVVKSVGVEFRVIMSPSAAGRSSERAT